MSTISLEDQIYDYLYQKPLPYLFIGSGFSRRYVGLEKWSELISLFANKVGENFLFLLSSQNGNIPKATSILSQKFTDQWFHDTNTSNKQVIYKDILISKDIPLKIEISEYLLNKVNSSSFLNKSEIEYLKRINVDGIITTNWDNFIESIFPDYETYIGQDELLFSNISWIGEIYKIHGCCSKPESLILTHDDYQNFEAKYAYLTAKLLTIFIERPIIFIGYSLADENIQAIFRSISKIITPENAKKLYDQFIFVTHDREKQGDAFTKEHRDIGGHLIPSMNEAVQ